MRKYCSNVISPGRNTSTAAPMPSGAAVMAGMPRSAHSLKILCRSSSTKKSRPVDVKVGTVEKGFRVALIDTLLEADQVELGVDAQRHLCHDVDLRPADRADIGADLPVEVVQLEVIEISQREFADSQTRQREQVRATHAAETGDGHALGAKGLLLALAHPTQISFEGLLIGKHRSSRWDPLFAREAS